MWTIFFFCNVTAVHFLSLQLDTTQHYAINAVHNSEDASKLIKRDSTCISFFMCQNHGSPQNISSTSVFTALIRKVT